MTACPACGRWRTILHFRLRGLIVLVLVLGSGLGWFVRGARIQREAVAAIKNAGGTVAYQWTYDRGMSNRNAEPWAPPWLVKQIGIDYFGHVTAIRLTNLSTNIDGPILDLGSLTDLQRIDLVRAAVSDPDLWRLKGLTKLSDLNLHGTPITDAGLVNIEGLVNLSRLCLGRTQITDAGLAHLKGLTNLYRLDLSFTRVADAGLTHLKSLTNLWELDLEATDVTDAGLEHLKGLANLARLDLSNTRVSESGVTSLQQTLPSMKFSRRYDTRPKKE